MELAYWGTSCKLAPAGGKDGKLIEGLSTLPSEKEILFKSETIFKVEKVGFSPNPEDYMIPIKTIWLKEL